MKRFATFLSHHVRHFTDDRKGAVAVLVASGIIAMMAAVGIATDAARGYILKARLAQALDAAALAGGRAFFSATREDEIRMYFDANFPPGFMGATLTGPTIAFDESAGTVVVNAEAEIDTTFMRLVKQYKIKVGGSTEVTRDTKALDLVIAIDMSGSMDTDLNGEPRIAAARQAAIDLVDILYGAETFKDLLSIGVVPWNAKVNVTLNGSTYDPDVTYDTVATPPAAVSPTYNHPLTGAPVTQHFFANNSPVPLLNRPPGRATTYNYPGSGLGLAISGSADTFQRRDGQSWTANGFVRGSQVTVSNAENSTHDGTYTIVRISTTSTTNDTIKVYPGFSPDRTDDTTAQVAGVYNWPGCVYARYVVNGTVPDESANLNTANDDLVDFTNSSDPQFANDADSDLYSKDFQPPFDTSRKWAAWEPIDGHGSVMPGGEECKMSPLDSSSECTVCLSHGITPLTSTKSEIVDAINELLTPEGTTNIPQGLAWAWRVLMPGSPFDEATANDDLTSDRQQAIVILTDGENYGGWGDAYKGVWGRSSSSRDEQNERLKTLAARIKDYHNTNPHPRQAEIEIYAIQFAFSSGALADLMKAVATKPHSPYYHYAPDKAKLQEVFKEVANHLSQLRISK